MILRHIVFPRSLDRSTPVDSAVTVVLADPVNLIALKTVLPLTCTGQGESFMKRYLLLLSLQPNTALVIICRVSYLSIEAMQT